MSPNKRQLEMLRNFLICVGVVGSVSSNEKAVLATLIFLALFLVMAGGSLLRASHRIERRLRRHSATLLALNTLFSWKSYANSKRPRR